MSSLWNSSSAESGILRKNDTRDKLEDLLVFGYACKLFRDDHKALEIDQGKHLIPWMGENSLKIDRYDGRGALSDLKPFEASKEGYDATRWLGLSESERKIEQLCDEERYFALHTNEEEDELYKEEELKRLQSNQIHYHYDDKADAKSEEQKTEAPLAPEEDDEPFIPAPGLDVPVNMVLPKTVKQNARIEKTASFISKQGPQMEILLKTKQSGNPQFSFLNQDDLLYRYYRHVLMAIKTGRFQIQEEQVKNEENEKQEEDHYLHPSLAPVGLQPVHSAPIIPQINYKPSANCAYSQLINKIKGNQSVAVADQAQAAVATSDPQHQYYQLQFYQQYGYWPQVDQAHAYYQQNQKNTPPLPPATTNQSQQYDQYMQYPSSSTTSSLNKESGVGGANPYAQIVSNVNKTKPEEDPKDVEPDPPELIPQLAQQPSLFSLAQYSGSESDDNDDENDEGGDAQAVVIPPVDVQIIIDKMASYVAKNGIDFENIVKAKGDPRFIFLEAKHLYNPYYKTKLREYQGDTTKITPKAAPPTNEAPDHVEAEQKDEKVDKKSTKSKEKKIITPVSFSIKKHSMDGQQVPRDKSALPIEDSTDDDDDDDNEQIDDQPSTNNEEEQPLVQPDNQPVATAIDEPEEITKSTVIEIEDPIMELIDLTEDLEEKRDRRAEDRVKDKLALAAREKLAAKNRALQLERKKRAAAFLSQLKPQSSSNTTKQENEEGAIEDGTETPIINEEYSRLVYHIENDKYANNETPRIVEKRPRSRSRSRGRNTHKSNRHQRKSHKRSHSHSRKRKREKRSHERKKSKRRHRSRSRSSSKHRKTEKKDVLADIENKNRKTEQFSVSSSDYESDDYPTNTNNTNNINK